MKRKRPTRLMHVIRARQVTREMRKKLDRLTHAVSLLACVLTTKEAPPK